MLIKIKKTVLWLFLGLLVMASQSMALKFEQYQEGQPRLKSVKTRFTNNTSYNLWLVTSAIDLSDRAAFTDLHPVGRLWVKPGETIEEENRFIISYETGYVFICESDCREVRVTPASFEPEIPYVTISLLKEVQKEGLFTIDIKREPVPIFIWGGHIKVPDEDKEWTYTMYNLDITVSEVAKQDL